LYRLQPGCFDEVFKLARSPVWSIPAGREKETPSSGGEKEKVLVIGGGPAD